MQSLLTARACSSVFRTSQNRLPIELLDVFRRHLSTRILLPTSTASLRPSCHHLHTSTIKRQGTVEDLRIESDPELLAFEYGRDEDPFRPPRFARCLLFALLASIGASGWAVLQEVSVSDDLKERLAEYRASTLTGRMFGSTRVDDFTSLELAMARRAAQQNDLVRSVANVKDTFGESVYRAVALVSDWWKTSSEAQMTCAGIIAVQVGIFAAWKVPPLRGFMSRKFLGYPWGSKSRAYQLLTCVFSHQSLWHIAFNSIAFYSFGPMVHQYFFAHHLQPDAPATATSRYEFIAFFICAGMASSLASHAFSSLVRWPALMRQVSRNTSTAPAALLPIPSLGASGAVYACFSLCAFAYPESQVSIIFLPFIPIPIGNAIYGMLAIDFFGLITGRRILGVAFDHAAHLGGALFGILYWRYASPVRERLADTARAALVQVKKEEEKLGPRV